MIAELKLMTLESKSLLKTDVHTSQCPVCIMALENKQALKTKVETSRCPVCAMTMIRIERKPLQRLLIGSKRLRCSVCVKNYLRWVQLLKLGMY